MPPFFFFKENNIAIQHRDIQEGDLHEPKGVSLAPSNTIYVSNGSGSGTWRKITTTDLNGLGTQPNADIEVVSDGSGGFKYIKRVAYGSITITNNANSFAITAAADSNLNTNSDYAVLTGTGAPWVTENLYGVGAASDGLIVETTGIYRVDTWMDITVYPSNTAKLAVKYKLGDVTFSTRKISSKSNSAGDAGSLSGFGLVALNAGTIVRLAVASTVTGPIRFESGNLTLSLVRATL